MINKKIIDWMEENLKGITQTLNEKVVIAYLDKGGFLHISEPYDSLRVAVINIAGFEGFEVLTDEEESHL